MSDFRITQGTSFRVSFHSVDPEGDPMDFTSSTIRLRVNFPFAIRDKTLTVDGFGVGSSVTGISLGQVDPLDHEAPLSDDSSSSGYWTVEFFPSDTLGVSPGDYPWESQVLKSGRVYPLRQGTITVAKSLFE